MTSPQTEADAMLATLESKAQVYANKSYRDGQLHRMLVAAYLAGARDAIAEILKEAKT